jgi:hypothetical protein
VIAGDDLEGTVTASARQIDGFDSRILRDVVSVPVIQGVDFSWPTRRLITKQFLDLKTRQDRGELGLLWARATFGDADGWLYYRATPETFYPSDLRWKSSLFMLHRASRLMLEVAQVRIQRLQDISEEDAKVEGVLPNIEQSPALCDGLRDQSGYGEICRSLWKRLHGQDSWQNNPKVAALTITVYQQNNNGFINKGRIS